MDPFVAEIRIVGFNFAPTGWAQCNGQLLPLSQNTALFALLGTTYGGDGKSTFALPNLQGLTAMHPGQGQGLSLRDLGEQGGSEFVTLLESEMPSHTHQIMGTGSNSTTGLPSADAALARAVGGNAYQNSPFNPTTSMALQTLTPAGASLPHNNMMPYLVLNYVIAMQGVFPPRP
ncbi:MAG TPA: tail fiber protein [Allosphingosinicella sp.]|nr:tail fiber protein [Allosphingosinicella sp.]